MADTVIETPAVTVTNDTSINELRAMLEPPSPQPIPVNGKQPLTVSQSAPEPEAKAKPVTQTPDADGDASQAHVDSTPERDEHGRFLPKAKDTATESGTVQAQEPKDKAEKTEESEEPESELPAGVIKRVKKIATETARIQAEIDRAVSAKKLAQAELDKLKAQDGTPGPEPVKNTAPPKPEGKPVRPVRPIFGETEGQTWGEYTAAVKKYEKDFDGYEDALAEWIETKSRKVTAEELAEQRQNEKIEWTREESRKKYGRKEFDDVCAHVLATASPELVVEIGGIEDWPAVIMHLGKSENEAELENLAALYEQNPSAALRTLGRIEDRLLKTVTKEPTSTSTNGTVKAAAKDTPLPAPPDRVGGGANAAPRIDTAFLEKADTRAFNKNIQSLLERR